MKPRTDLQKTFALQFGDDWPTVERWWDRNVARENRAMIRWLAGGRREEDWPLPMTHPSHPFPERLKSLGLACPFGTV